MQGNPGHPVGGTVDGVNGAALHRPPNEGPCVRIEQLEYLAAVTQHGSLRRASEALHLSQPALNEALGKLERELGVPLLDRRRSGARISRQGQDLVPYMAQVLDAVDRLRQAAGDQTLVARNLRIGTVNAANSTLLVPAVHSFRQCADGTGVEVLSTRQTEIYQGLVEGSLDLGLVNVLPGDDAATPHGVCATELKSGICVFDPRHERTIVGARVDNVLVRNFEGDGVVGVDTRGLIVNNVMALNNARYGVTRFDSTGGQFINNSATGSGDAGIYIGDSPDAQLFIAGNDVWNNGFGILVRNAQHVSIEYNDVHDNCI